MFGRRFVMDLINNVENMRCQYCRVVNVPDEWPTNGMYVPFYYQTDKDSGTYFLTMNCPECNKTWYVAWDDYPGEFVRLTETEKNLLRKKLLG